MPRGRVATEHPTTRTIRIDQEVYEWLQSKATPFRDGPNNVLRRMMEKERAKLIRRAAGGVPDEDNRSVGDDLRNGS